MQKGRGVAVKQNPPSTPKKKFCLRSFLSGRCDDGVSLLYPSVPRTLHTIDIAETLLPYRLDMGPKDQKHHSKGKQKSYMRS